MVLINWPRYIILLILSTSIFLAFSRDLKDVYGVLIALIATLANQYLLVQGVKEFVLNARDGEKQKNKGNKKVLVFFLLKFLILFGGFYAAYQFMDKQVIFPILNYVVLIFVLTLSIKGFKHSS